MKSPTASLLFFTPWRSFRRTNMTRCRQRTPPNRLQADRVVHSVLSLGQDYRDDPWPTAKSVFWWKTFVNWQASTLNFWIMTTLCIALLVLFNVSLVTSFAYTIPTRSVRVPSNRRINEIAVGAAELRIRWSTHLMYRNSRDPATRINKPHQWTQTIWDVLANVANVDTTGPQASKSRHPTIRASVESDQGKFS